MFIKDFSLTSALEMRFPPLFLKECLNQSLPRWNSLVCPLTIK